MLMERNYKDGGGDSNDDNDYDQDGNIHVHKKSRICKPGPPVPRDTRFYLLWPMDHVRNNAWQFIFLINMLGNDYVPSIISQYNSSKLWILKQTIDKVLDTNGTYTAGVAANSIASSTSRCFNINTVAETIRVFVQNMHSDRVDLMSELLDTGDVVGHPAGGEPQDNRGVRRQTSPYNWQTFYTQQVDAMLAGMGRGKNKNLFVPTYKKLMNILYKNAVFRRNIMRKGNMAGTADMSVRHRISLIETIAHVLNIFLSSTWYTCYVLSYNSLTNDGKFNSTGYQYLNNTFSLVPRNNSHFNITRVVGRKRARPSILSTGQRRHYSAMNAQHTANYIGDRICWYYFVHQNLVELVIGNLINMLKKTI